MGLTLAHISSVRRRSSNAAAAARCCGVGEGNTIRIYPAVHRLLQSIMQVWCWCRHLVVDHDGVLVGVQTMEGVGESI
jgi:hypothetical protein